MSAERPTRRNFLKGPLASRNRGTSLREGVSVGPHFSGGESPQAASLPLLATNRSSLLVSVRRRAMACEFEAQLAAARDDNAMEHVFAALDLVEWLESQMTVYRDESAVMDINRRAASEPVPVEPRLFALLQEAARLYDETDGALDITTGPLSQIWGFSRREGRVPEEDAIQRALACVGMHHLELDETKLAIRFDRSGVAINLNSLGKGYALDRMSELLAEHEVDDYLLHGGKSSVLARGDQPGSDAPGWTIGLRHPLRPAERVAEIELRDRALSTSGSGTQFFIRRGRRYGHILDPRTGRPAEGLYSATVIAPTGALAEGLSTAFYVLGPEHVSEYCAARPEIGAILIGPAQREGDVQLYAFGLDDSEWLPLIDR